MRYPFATEFKFDFQGEELTAYFDSSDNLIHLDTDNFDLTGNQIFHAKHKAQCDYDDFLKNQEAEAKDWENTKWHLNKQFTQF